MAADLEDLRAQDILDGTTTRLGVVAKGRTLTLRLRKRVPTCPGRARLCAVPPSLPADPRGREGATAERRALLRRRVHARARGSCSSATASTEARDRTTSTASSPTWPPTRLRSTTVSGEGRLFAWVPATDIAAAAAELAQRYGVNRSQFWVPGSSLRMFVLNTSRPLFRNNPKLRQAINFAVDRRALTASSAPASAPQPTSTSPLSCRGSATSASTRSRALTRRLARSPRATGGAPRPSCTRPTCRPGSRGRRSCSGT